MATVVVKPVLTRRERRRFLELPWTLYRGDPNWVPPLRRNQKELVGYAPHPFYQDAECQTFLALRAGQPCGRVAAVINRAHDRQHQEKRGFFGFFESIDDPEVAGGLFDAARAWLAERGYHTVRGPVNPSVNYEMGLLVEGFGRPPMFMMTYNPPYYERLIEGYGFRKAQDAYAYWGQMDMIATLDPKLDVLAEEAKKRFRVTTRTIDRKRFAPEVRAFLGIYNESMRGMWGHVPLSEAEVQHAARGLKHLLVPDLTVLALVDGQPVAAVLGLLDYGPVIKAIDGRLFPFGFLRLLWRRRAIRQFRIVSANVVPHLQNWGLGLMMLVDLYYRAEAWGMEACEFSWVFESNHLSRASLEKGGARKYKTYRLYDFAPAEGRV
ncbi:MAG: hypothetical protein IT536_21785 [Hyphomicrobiales bacterium]|nr:hypothetical protein [Hyphomicrobiales bacterium]